MASLVSQRNVRFIEVILNIIWYMQWITLIVFNVVFVLGMLKNGSAFDKFPLRFSFPMNFVQEQAGKFRLADGELIPTQVQLESVLIKLPLAHETLLPWGLLSLLDMGVFLGILFLLRKIVVSVKADLPFSRENWNRVRILGLLIAGKEVAGAIITFLAHNYFRTRVLVEGMTLSSVEFDLDGEWMLMGLVLILLAEIFKAGAVLQEERELTI
jgi:hypothetical protein